GNRFAIGQQVVEQGSGGCKALPLGFIAADAMQEVEDGILLVPRVTGRRIDIHLSSCADGLRVVLDHFQLAVRNTFALVVESRRRVGEDLFVIRAEDDLAVAARRWPARLVVSLCGLSLLRLEEQRGKAM